MQVGNSSSGDYQLFVKQVKPRQYVAQIPQLPNTEVWFQRPTYIFRKLLSGDLDLRIVGLDTLREYGQENEDLIIVHEALIFGDCHLSIEYNRFIFKEDHTKDNGFEIAKELSVLHPSNPKHEAAIKLKKVENFGICLKRSSISFFNIEKHETAMSTWSRARPREANIGKGLSKNGKAQKLALQHWLEMIDPSHRYGHNLRFYYNKLLNSQSRESFFYRLDIGEGKEVNVVEKCPRLKHQQQCIKYLGLMERKDMRWLWNTENSIISIVEKFFKLLRWKIVNPNGFLCLAHQRSYIWGRRRRVHFNIQAS